MKVEMLKSQLKG